MDLLIQQSERYEVKYTVLLIEDEPAHAELITRSFEHHEQFSIIVATSLSAARKYLLKENPDLIITDIRLPDGEGTEFLKQFQKDKNCPVIVMTSFGDETTAVNAMKAGAVDYIIKSEQTFTELPTVANRVLREWRLILDRKVALDQQNRLTSILEATPDLICIADIDGFLTYLNESGYNLLGLSLGEDISKIRLADFHSVDDAKLIMNKGIPYAIENDIWSCETTFIAKDGNEILTSQVLLTHKSEGGEIEFFSTIARDIRHIRSAEEKIEYLAYYDTLTDLPNRNELLRRLEFELSRTQRHDAQSALLFIDLDDFKNINDSLGHPTGDLVLKEVASRLRAVIRGEDTLARLGGDEFIVILTDLDNDYISALNQVRHISNKLNEHISTDLHIGKMTFNITASIGLSMFSAETNNAHELLQFADTAMYQAKKAGKNGFEVFHKGMGDDVSRLLELELKLRKACLNQEFVLYYQAKVDAKDGKLNGAEALLRWDDPFKGITSPAVFLDVLESSGLINEVGEIVIEQSFKQLAIWIAEGLWDTKNHLSINISARQFHDKQFSVFIFHLLDKINIPPQCIDIEITEHSVINDVSKAIEIMNKMIKRGISFSLDDFGTGYSSLSYLKALPVSTIKIDQSFVKDLDNNTDDQALVSSILAIANNLKLDVVAEGVETLEQSEILKEYGCESLQGYLFSKPMPASEFLKLLEL